jgi:hypothetical protein
VTRSKYQTYSGFASRCPLLTATDSDPSTTASDEVSKEGPETMPFAAFLGDVGVVRLDSDGPDGAPGVEVANG